MERRLWHAYALAFIVAYPVGVGFMAFWKLFTGLPDETLPWLEVAYGPALTIASAFALLLASAGITNLVSARAKGRSHPAPRGRTHP